MDTNGITLDRKVAERLAGAGMESVVVSFDGPKSCHDWLRNRKGAYEKACRAIASLKQAGVPIVEAITCVTPRSLPRMGETYELVGSLGATHWRVFNIFPAGRAKGDPELLLDEESIRKLVRAMARLREKGARDGLVCNLSEEGYLGWRWEGRVRDTPYFCRAGINIAGILSDGSIAACPNLPPWMTQGNIATDDFTEVWENEYGLFRDRSWTRQGMCGHCPRWRVCRGSSLHLWNPDAGQPHWCHYRIMNPAHRR
jgi:radical SAM protein with 4Fe4S-binding SPASM domain